MSFEPRIKVTEQVLTAIRNGDECLSEQLYNDYRLFISSTAKRYSFTKDDFEENVAAGNLGLAKALERFDTSRGTAFLTYAYYLIKHEIIMRLRKEYKQINNSNFAVCSLYETVSIKHEADLCFEDVIADNSESPVDKVISTIEAEKIAEIVHSVIRTAPSNQQEVLLLMLEGKTQCCIAESLGISQTTVSRVQHRFKQKLLYELGRCSMIC